MQYEHQYVISFFELSYNERTLTQNCAKRGIYRNSNIPVGWCQAIFTICSEFKYYSTYLYYVYGMSFCKYLFYNCLKSIKILIFISENADFGILLFTRLLFHANGRLNCICLTFHRQTIHEIGFFGEGGGHPKIAKKYYLFRNQIFSALLNWNPHHCFDFYQIKLFGYRKTKLFRNPLRIVMGQKRTQKSRFFSPDLCRFRKIPENKTS